jgi:hypothetical protein
VVAAGKVEGIPGREGKLISLQVSARQARMQDLVRLAVKSGKSPMTGGLESLFELPPGKKDVVDKLYLKGNFDRVLFRRCSVVNRRHLGLFTIIALWLSASRRCSMLWTVFVILLIMWLLGFFAFHVGGGLIHLVLLIAAIVLVVNLLTGHRATA